ncbi:MAG: DUF4249 domain-containing protein [Saprospiraceae bacterium]|nr:DUF4249 domain-containing protein [Saprospiraceae bacterium]
MNIKLLWYLTLFSPLFWSCREEIRLETVDSPLQLVVEGGISNSLQQHQVRLSSSTATGEKSRPIQGAELRMSSGEEEFYFVETEAGLYRSDSLAGIPGQQYTLQINWNGKLFFAVDEMPPAPIQVDTIRFIPEVDQFDFEFRRHLFGFTEPNRWRLWVIPQVKNPAFDSTRAGLQQGVQAYSGGIHEFTFYTHARLAVNGLINFEEPHFYGFDPGFTVILEKEALSSSYYAFLRSVFMETEWRGTLFDTQPANLQGNVSNGGLGYFSAVSLKRITYQPD